MPRLSARIQIAPYGSRNPVVPGRSIAPSIQHRGPALPFENFADEQLDGPTRRALLQMQQNVRQAFGQVRSSPFASANLVQGVTLAQGSANGSAPNIVSHGLGVAPSGYAILSTTGGYVTAHARIAPATGDPNSIIRIWTQFTAFAGAASVLADLLVYA